MLDVGSLHFMVGAIRYLFKFSKDGFLDWKEGYRLGHPIDHGL